MKVKDLPSEELLFGHFACAGCGGALAVRLALKVLGREVAVVVPPSCLLGVATFHPQMAFRVPCVNSVMPATGAVASGLAAGLKRRGQAGVKVVAIAGDGGTFDIGLQALSGAVERGHDFLFLCYDNEAYMNTGFQRSGATPWGAATSTGPSGSRPLWEDRPKKDMLRIMAAHNIPYAATASVAYPRDFMEKVRRAAVVKGPSYIQVLSPCPTGWGYEPHLTVEMGRLAVETGMWTLAEYYEGEFRVTHRPSRRKPVREYLTAQRRFAHLTEGETERLQAEADCCR